jgi:hypothetical protein
MPIPNRQIRTYVKTSQNTTPTWFSGPGNASSSTKYWACTDTDVFSPGINADLMEVRSGRVCRVNGAVTSNIAPVIDTPYIVKPIPSTEDGGVIKMDGADNDGETKAPKCKTMA